MPPLPKWQTGANQPILYLAAPAQAFLAEVAPEMHWLLPITPPMRLLFLPRHNLAIKTPDVFLEMVLASFCLKNFRTHRCINKTQLH